MNSLRFLILFLITFELSAQTNESTPIVFEFYPAFEQSSEIRIDFRKAKVGITFKNQAKKEKIRLIDEETRILNTLVDSILNNLERPVVTMTIDGKEHFLEDFYAEDGMMVYLELTNPESREELGNIFTPTQAELLTKLLNFISERTNNSEYFNKLLEYLD